jgi:hypothetical protein
MWLLSYNDCEAIRELYRDYQIEVVTTRYTLCGSAEGIARELLIRNF